MRIANPNPVYCSSCFQQKPHDTHVDFEVAWDGPVISLDGLRMTIDDLVICKDCLISAAGLVGMVDADDDIRAKLKEMVSKTSTERKGRLSAEQRVKELEHKLAAFERAQTVFLHAREALESVHLEVNGA